MNRPNELLGALLSEGRMSVNEARTILQFITEATIAERKRCAEAVLSERLNGEASDPTDIAYALAIEHAHDAIWRAT